MSDRLLLDFGTVHFDLKIAQVKLLNKLKATKIRQCKEIDSKFNTGLPDVLVEFTPKKVIKSINEPHDLLPTKRSSIWKNLTWALENEQALLEGNARSMCH